MLVDSHCHLDFPDFAGELDGVIARAAAAGPADFSRTVRLYGKQCLSVRPISPSEL